MRVTVDFEGAHTGPDGAALQHVIVDSHGILMRVRNAGFGPVADDPLVTRIVYDDAARDATTGQCGVILRKRPDSTTLGTQPIFEYSVIAPFFEAYQRRVAELATAEAT